MIEDKDRGLDVLDRIMSSYGANTQKQLAEFLDIPANNISGWVQRESVPGSAIIKCALDTGADLRWLVLGELANANCGARPLSDKGKALYDRVMANGGRTVLTRILNAYGFSTQKQLCDLLDISSGTVSTWIRREYFPGDVVITCALDTGASLSWLATGVEDSRDKLHWARAEEEKFKIEIIPKKTINGGKLADAGQWAVDESFIAGLPDDIAYVENEKSAWLVDLGTTTLGNGAWLIDIDGNCDIYTAIRLPGNKVKLSKEGFDFDCMTSDVECLGQVKRSIKNA